jgi:methyltransferase (TIGR00027 family)
MAGDRRMRAAGSAGLTSPDVRSDNDSWDITTSVGSTALFVAAARALEATKPEPLAVDPFAEVFCRAAGGIWAGLLDGAAPGHPLRSAEFGAHFVTYQGARTRYFDEYFRTAADGGIRQIVILAAGLDSRAFRLDWPHGTTVFELDQPRVLEFKRQIVERRGDSPTADRREVAVDLRDDWPSALRASGFQTSEPSAWIAEGLLIYLPAAVYRDRRIDRQRQPTRPGGGDADGPRGLQSQSRRGQGVYRHARSVVADGVQRAVCPSGAMVFPTRMAR